MRDKEKVTPYMMNALCLLLSQAFMIEAVDVPIAHSISWIYDTMDTAACCSFSSAFIFGLVSQKYKISL